MISTPRDANRIPALVSVLDSDGVTTISVLADPTTHALLLDIGMGGSDNGVPTAQRDANRVPSLLGTSYVDGVTPVEVYASSPGYLYAE